MVKDLIHQQIVAHKDKVLDWFMSYRKDLIVPFYTSYDLREASQKIAPVDANIFPAGFNNICQQDKDTATEIVKNYLSDHYPARWNNVALVTEEHTNNPFYWENVHTLMTLIENAGAKVRVAVPKSLSEPIHLESSNGHPIKVFGTEVSSTGDVVIDGEKVDLVICNNDFSVSNMEWSQGMSTPMNPPYNLGWHTRKKSDFFDQYNKLATEFAEMINIDPFHLTVKTNLFPAFDINSEESRLELADQVEQFLSEQKEAYLKHNFDSDPYVFIKNNSGTYGLGVIQANSADEIKTWNNKSRKKMKAAKGGGGFGEVIIQEGIPSIVQSSGETAEPAIYMVGCQLAGGFLRAHSKKGPTESLNSPGAVYQRLCVSDLSISIEGLPMENVYGWIAKLGLLAVSMEARQSKVEFIGYENPSACTL